MAPIYINKCIFFASHSLPGLQTGRIENAGRYPDQENCYRGITYLFQ